MPLKPSTNHLTELEVVVSLLWLTIHKLLVETRSYEHIRCHEAARIWCEALKFRGYEARLVDGFFDIKHSWTQYGISVKGDLALHSWVEIRDKIVETDPRQVFPEEHARIKDTPIAKLMVIHKDDWKASYYKEAKNHEEKELFKKAIERKGGINRDIVEKLVALITNHMKKCWV